MTQNTAISTVNPPELRPPVSLYSHGIEVGTGARWLYVSGQAGISPNGEILNGLEAQINEALSKIATVLAGARMSKRDLVKLTAYVSVSGPEPLAVYRRVRDAWLEGHTPGSTYLVVTSLAHRDLLVEIEAVAAAL